MHRGTMAPLIAWGKWAVNWTAHDLSVRLSSHSSLCAPKAGGEAWEVPGGMVSVLHAVPQSGPPPNLKHSVNGEILPVPSKKGRKVGSPTALAMGEDAMQDLVHWLHAAGGSSLASFASPGVSHEELWWPGHWACSSPPPASAAALRAKAPHLRQKRKQKRICMPRLHPASTKLPAGEHRRTSCLFPNLWREKQGGKGEGE